MGYIVLNKYLYRGRERERERESASIPIHLLLWVVKVLFGCSFCVFRAAGFKSSSACGLGFMREASYVTVFSFGARDGF